MAVQDVVSILATYYEDGEEAFRDRHGAEAAIAVRDVIDLLEGELGSQLDYDTLWAEFESAPRETAPDLAGALEAMVEADPGLADQLEVLLEEYYATSEPAARVEGVDVAPTEPSEVVPREEQRVETHEVEPRSHTDVAGEGTYLYGNVRGGADLAVEKPAEQEADVLSVHRELEMLSFDVGELFEQLQLTVEREPAFGDEERAELQTALEELEVELMLGEEADEGRIVELLRRLGRLDPDFLALVLTGLRRTETEAQYLVQDAIARVSEG